MSHLTKAKSQLVMDQPFFASLLLGTHIIPDASVKTLTTNGETIRYNPEYLDTLSLPETVFALAHETMHCVFQHMHRRGTRDANKWNIAADYVVNDMLVKDKVGVIRPEWLNNPTLVASTNGTTEAVYDVLPDSDKEKQAGDSKNGGSQDCVEDAGQDDAEIAENEAKMKVRITQAANAAKMAGKLSGGLARLVKEVTQAKADWKALLRRFITERAKTELSYAKPKRRFLADDIILPGLTGEQMGSIVVAIDCSGSVNEALLNEFASEVKAIIEDTAPNVVHVVYFDSEVLRQDSFTRDDAFQINACGGGGTAFSPVFEHIEAKQLQPVACVFLTDLECSDYGACPSYPVLWASTGRENSAPFGEVVKLR